MPRRPIRSTARVTTRPDPAGLWLASGTLILAGALALAAAPGHAQTTPPAPQASTAAPPAPVQGSGAAMNVAPAGATTAPATAAAAPSAPAAGAAPAAPADAAAPPAGTPAPAAATAASPAGAPAAPMPAMRSATANVAMADGTSVGTASISETASGVTLVNVALTAIPAGPHAVHIHETGACEGPDFKSAGGHLSGGKTHGVHDAGGIHTGDLPNVTAAADGAVTAEFLAPQLTLDQVMDADGAAFVVHAGKDDYVSQPAGNSGDRMACGVFATATN